MRPLLLILVALAWAGAKPQAAEKRPNVLLVITDDQGYGDLSCHGNPHLKTLQIDALARASFRLTQFHVNPLCAPTRAALLTGRYSIRSGVAGVARGEETMNADEVTLGECFQGAGYRTGYFGKWHNGEHYPYTPNGQGFEQALGFNLGHWNNYFDTALKENGRWVATRGFLPDVLTDAAVRFIDANREKPWLCYLAYNTPHSPLQCPEAEFRKYKDKGLSDDLAAVYGMCENLDANVGRLLKKLDDAKLADDTIVVFLTDNGPNGDRFNGGMRGRKGTWYRGGTRVPCFLRWPGRFVKPTEVNPVTAHIDLLPTLLELCGIAAPKGVALDGRSLVPLLEGKTDRWAERTLFLTNKPWQEGAREVGTVLAGRHRLVNPGRGWELYDVEADPGEKKNLASEKPEQTRELSRAFQTWWKEASRDVRLRPPPIPVGHAKEDPVELPVPQAELAGGVKFSGRHPNNAWVVGWDGEGAQLTWRLDVVEAGEYTASVAFLCERPGEGGRIRLTAGERKAEAATKATARKQKASPDRSPRTEVFEMEWATLPLGNIRLDKGKQTVMLEMTRPDASFELKHVSLEKKK